jgi:DNA modification methylase
LCCLSAKEWIKNQLGVWQFSYEGRDVRDKAIHPATFPIALARRVTEQFAHEDQLVLDPFVGSGTTLVAAQDAARNAVGFDLLAQYIDTAKAALASCHLMVHSNLPFVTTLGTSQTTWSLRL